MKNTTATKNQYIIPFEQLGTEMAKDGHWTESFKTGIGTDSDQFTIERENFGDADSPMLTQVVNDDGMKHIAGTLGAWYGRRFKDNAECFDGDVNAFMDSNYGGQVWQDYELLMHDVVPYLDELDTSRFATGDKVFSIQSKRYGTVRSVDGNTVHLDDGTSEEAMYLLKPSDDIFQ